MRGKVTLVGAGPGAPDLITVRGLKALQQAEILLYDRLIHPDLLNHAPLRAQRIYVGKEKGSAQQQQERIYALMIGYALEGKRVVRLKGGDPFVFGRGGEELERLARFGIEAEVIPGISSCIAGPGSAQIPVTHRGISASFGVFAGQPGEQNGSELNWRAAAGLGTAVFLMGIERLPLIIEKLQEEGLPATTPIALIEKATWEDEKVVTGTLETIQERAKEINPPAIIVVGETVTLAASLRASAWESPTLAVSI